ncbi:MAG: cadherin domain-containing protein, partial [Rivularia sp. (in: cyanobacteria)]
TSGGSIEVGNSRIYRSSGEQYTIVYAGEDGVVNDGDDQLVVDYLRAGTINVVDVYLGDEKKGQIIGLLGNLNDNRDDDIALRDGTILSRPLEFDRLYGDYRDDYHIKDISESLFTYEEGQNPDTFYNPNFPKVLFSYKNLSPELKAKGDAAALKAGYTPGTFEFESAAFDFAVTGDPGFLEGRETDPEVTEPLTIVNTVNQPPTITSNPNFSVPENTTTVGIITAEDADGNNLSFSISNGADRALFTIDSNSGELTFNNAPDFETAADTDADNNYQVQVSVTDGSEIVTQDLTVSVTDVDEANNEAPTIDDATFTVDENSASGTQVGIINATDPENEALTFAIASGNLDPDNDNNLAFAIDSLTGAITVNDSDDLDFKTNPSFNLEVTVTDPGNLSATADITINLADQPLTQIDTSQSQNGIFTLNGGDSTNVKFTLTNNDTEKVNEVGVFLVDDENGNINGNAPGSDGYLQAALEKAQVIFSAISNRPSGFNLGDIERVIEVDGDARLGFYLISNGTTDTALAQLEKTGTTSLPVFFSDSSNLQVSDLSGEGFKLNWSDTIGNSDFTDMELSVQLTQEAPAPFTRLQGEAQKELIDLRDVTGQVSVSAEVYREAAFDNLIGFYQVVDSNGGIDTNGDGIADFNPGDTGYEEAALTNRVTGLDLLQTDNQQTTTFDGILEGGNIFASFMVVDGTINEAINNNAEVYFSFLGANSDGVDHIRLLGDNTFGFEDLAGGGDFDYNDMIVKVNFATV